MPQSNLYEARKHCDAMRDLILQHKGGWADAASLAKLEQMAQSAAAAVEDPECKHLASLVIDLAADLFSALGHEKWARGQTSGADVLRLRILREISAFQGRLTYIEAMGR